MEPKKVSNSLAMRKVAALTKGDLKEEDCVMISFLIGSEDSDAEEIRACKFDLVVASEYFQRVLRSPLTPAGPIRIKHVEPDTFRLVVEFLSGQLVTEVNDLEQWLKLAAAADEFLIDELGQLCTEKLEELINVDNVWTIFSKNHLVKYTSAVCEKLLSSKTEECLKKPAFLEIDENALVKFLNVEKMSINSEMQLVSACLEFVSRKEDGRAVFRRCALPHLRLLTLSADDDLSQLAPFLENEEEMILILNIQEKDSLQIKNDLLVNTTLCKNAKPRNPVEGKLQESEDFILPVELLDYRSKICQGDYRQFQYTWSSGGVVLTVEGSNVNKTTGFDILRKTDEQFKEDAKIYGLDLGWFFKTTANVKITSEDGICIQSVDLDSSEACDIEDLFKPFMLKGGKFQVEVTMDKTFTFGSSNCYQNAQERSLEDFLQQLRAHGHKKFSLVWHTYKCPHLNMAKPLPEEGIDLSGSRESAKWICLSCHEELKFSVFDTSNTLQHSKEHSHPLFLDLSFLDILCAECNQYVDAPALYDYKDAGHLVRFGTKMPWTSGGQIKIE